MTQEFEEILRETLEDQRMSRGEKKALGRLLAPIVSDQRRRALLRSQAFDVARAELLGPQAHAVVDWLEEVVKLLQPQDDQPTERTEAYFMPGDNGPRAVVGLIAAARQSADICVFTITDDRISSAIRDAHRRGVQVRVVSDNEKAEDLGSDIEALRRDGLPVRVDRSEHHMHHKFAIFDQKTTLTGSYNWTRSAAVANAENFIISRDRLLAQTFGQEFEKIWSQAE